jgi:hypothetical protein
MPLSAKPMGIQESGELTKDYTIHGMSDMNCNAKKEHSCRTLT